MRSPGLATAVVLLLAGGVIVFALSPSRATSPNAVVVLELFTSQGCSSCPPADALLAELGNETFAGRVIPLSWHVDYWNHLGWRDPFSTAEASARQRAYARVLRSGVYTPQLVVNGRSQFVGSAEGVIRGELKRQLAQAPQATVTIDRVAVGASAMTVTASSSFEPKLSGRRMALEIVVFERSAATAVRAGENEGRRLANAYIVRRHVTLDPRGGSVDLTLDPSWRGLGVAALLQDRDSLTIYAATTRPLS